jgi:hypothetical protein
MRSDKQARTERLKQEVSDCNRFPRGFVRKMEHPHDEEDVSPDFFLLPAGRRFHSFPSGVPPGPGAANNADMLIPGPLL